MAKSNAEPKAKKGLMEILGFSGWDSPTNGCLTFIVSIVMGVSVYIFVGAVATEVLVGIPVLRDMFDGVVKPLLFIGGSIVVSFFVVYLRHTILLVVFSLCAAIGIYNLVHATTIEKDKFFPPAVVAMFAPSEERLAELEALSGERLARVKGTYFLHGFTNVAGEPITPGAVVVVTVDEDPKARQRFTIRYRGKEQKFRYVSDFQYLPTDRTVATIAASRLLASPTGDSSLIREIPKGERVTLTGESSSGDKMLEVVHNGDRGWVAAAGVFDPIDSQSSKGVRPAAKKPSIPITAAAATLLAVLYVVRGTRAYRIALPKYIEYFKMLYGKYPWYVNYCKRHGWVLDKQAKNHARTASEGELIKMVVLFGVWVGVGYLLNIGLSFANVVFLMGDTARSLGSILGPIVAVIATWSCLPPWKLGSASTYGIECKCGCPHSVDIIRKEVIVDGAATEGNTVTTTTTDSDGWRSTDTTTYTNRYYYGRVLTDYKCYNCEREWRKTEKTEWRGDLKAWTSALYGNNIKVYSDADIPDEWAEDYTNEELEEISRITREQAKAKT